ncbi:MAG: phage/plasmid primase, P4 family [Patescibacteria group bacterium]
MNDFYEDELLAEPVITSDDHSSPTTSLSSEATHATCVTNKNNPILEDEIMSSIVDNRRILNPATPRDTAQIFINDNFRSMGIRSIQCIDENKQFYEFVNGHYKPVSDLRIQADIARFLNSSWRIKSDPITKINTIVPYDTKSAKEKEILDALKCISSEGVYKDPAIQPSWIFNFDDHQDPNLIIPFKNKLLDIPTFLKSGNAFNSLIPITPKFLNCTQIPFDIDPNDHKTLLPMKFIGFLESIFNESFIDKSNSSSIEFIRQWMGYCLTNMTWAQKILLIVGPPRSGKGTIANVMQSMLGEANYTNPSANSLIERFPLEGWVNKRLAILGDARFGDKKETVKEILLQVSGGDRVNIDRKNKSILSGVRLPTKIMMISNEIPKIRDAGAALSSRFMVLKLTKSFLGNEDENLFERDLLPELPKIFWWALDGLRDLMGPIQNRKFIQPESGKDSIDQMKAYESPVSQFIKEKCTVAPSESISKEVIFNIYCLWCKDEGITHLSYNIFCDHVLSSCHSVTARRMGSDGSRVQSFFGICSKDRSKSNLNIHG